MIKISDLFKILFQNDSLERRSNITCLKHSFTVAKAAEIISKEIESIDPEKAFLFGLLHDVGKLYLPKVKRYKHPLLGFEMLKDFDPEVAAICLSHPFPQLANCFEYIKYYCQEDVEEAKNISIHLSNVNNSIYIKLIQLCDKISGSDKFVSLEDKFLCYKNKHETSDKFVTKNYDTLVKIKMELEDTAKCDIYSLLSIYQDKGLQNEN